MVSASSVVASASAVIAPTSVSSTTTTTAVTISSAITTTSSVVAFFHVTLRFLHRSFAAQFQLATSIIDVEKFYLDGIAQGKYVFHLIYVGIREFGYV